VRLVFSFVDVTVAAPLRQGERSLQPDLVGADRIALVASTVASRHLDASS
jgi:hypothetical protein